MRKMRIAWMLVWLLVVAISFPFFVQVSSGQADTHGQIPTGSIPTVTGTPVGAIAIVLPSDQGIANVRSGPNAAVYELIGVLVEGQTVPALGRSPGGEWIQIAYPGAPGGVGWVWKDLVEVKGSLPIVEPPPTPTPHITATIDPTLAAQFLVDIPPTRLPTFTPPPSLGAPTPMSQSFETTPANRIPMGLVIIILAFVGVFGTLISFAGGR